MVYFGGLAGLDSPSQLSCSVPELLTCEANPLSPSGGCGLQLLVVEDTDPPHGETEEEGGVRGSGDGEFSRGSGSAGVARAESHGSSPLSLLLSAQPVSAAPARGPSESSRHRADSRSRPLSDQSLEQSFTYRKPI